jgi:FkbM family methyltransferase
MKSTNTKPTNVKIADRDHVKVELRQGGGVPGGHMVIIDGDKKPFICPTKEMLSIDFDERDIVIDIGAYTGTFSVICARYPVKQVYAYEPTPFSFKICDTLKFVNLKCFNKAVVGDNDESKKVSLYISRGIGVTNSLVKKRAKVDKIDIDAIKYSDIIKNATIVKIDIEGGEYNIIPNLIQPHIRGYIIDFHNVKDIDWLEKANAIIKKLKDFGYRCIIEPNFTNGWTMAGSWVKDDFKFKTEPNSDLVNGKLCCGCNKKINCNKKGLCKECYKLWTPKHRKNFECNKEQTEDIDDLSEIILEDSSDDEDVEDIVEGINKI